MDEKTARILIVEDEALISSLLEKMLIQLGYEPVGVLTSGEEAIEAATEDSFDLILMDIRLQGALNGIETAEQISTVTEIPIIFVTAFIDDELLQKAKAITPYGYLLKPVQKGPLKATIEIALNLAHAVAERTVAEQERKHLQRRLQQSQKMEALGTLAGGIAHDFNNVLQPIIGLSKLGMQTDHEIAKHREYFGAIYKAGQRARDMIQQILAFSRQQDSELKVVQLQPVIREILKMLERNLPARVEIESDIHPDCGAIRTDKTQIHQIVFNLATNAYHAMEEKGGTLYINLHPFQICRGSEINEKVAPGEYVRLVVRDTGVGMTSGVVDKIFDPYFTTKDIDKGTGLGLSVVLGIVKGHRGSIDVSSEPGRGTEFNIYFPVVEPGEKGSPQVTR